MNKQIAALKDGDRKEIEKLYNQYRGGFILFLSRYGLPQEDLTDIYQDALVALVENARKGLLDELQVELKTYLFAIGKFMVFKKLKREREIDAKELHLEWYHSDEGEQATPALAEALHKLGERCYQLLKLFYYEEKKLEEIRTIMGYDKKEVVKSQKSRCLKQLKELLGNG